MGICIYSGEGAIPLSLPGSHLLTAAAIATTPWQKKYSLFIMPGGRDRPYHAALQGPGCRHIRHFVEEGGTYIGLCAGAYFGAKEVQFDQGFPLEVSEERELSFFSGVAVGPAYGKGSFDYHSQKGARAAKLTTPYGSFHTYYNGGCTFLGDFSNCRILARYADLPRQPPAILECQVGKGKAILSGVHIETDANTLDPQDPFLREIIPLLLDSEPLRKQMWEKLMQGSAL